jgi:hypothetical protein
MRQPSDCSTGSAGPTPDPKDGDVTHVSEKQMAIIDRIERKLYE